MRQDFQDLEELTEEKLGFSALSDGLGFSSQKRRYSVTSSNDQLVKTPEQEKNSSSAQNTSPGNFSVKTSIGQKQPKPYQKHFAGASVAGTPQFVFPENKQEKKNESLAEKVAQSAPLKTSTAAQTLLEPAAKPFVRLNAFFADLFFTAAPISACFALLFSRDQVLLLFREHTGSLLFFYGVILVSYFLLSESFGGQSPGKMLFGLRIVEDDKYEKPAGFWASLSRIPVTAAATAILGLGLMSAFFDKKRRPWQDKITGTIVRKKP